MVHIHTSTSSPAVKINSQLFWAPIHQTPWIDVCTHTSCAGSIVNGVISGHGTITCSTCPIINCQPSNVISHTSLV